MADGPRALGGGALYLLLFGASQAQVPLLVDISVGLGGTLLAPVWYIGSGLVLIKRAGTLNSI